ncbi:hypothetical protein ACFPKZ_19135 [Streptosporangium amethystogenes subsp. fukuiense]|uniref:hypothetical protein n=1 Tax=Streptosporangium amethystogenes TaxID=2002 RepID=UPI0036161216
MKENDVSFASGPSGRGGHGRHLDRVRPAHVVVAEGDRPRLGDLLEWRPRSLVGGNADRTHAACLIGTR